MDRTASWDGLALQLARFFRLAPDGSVLQLLSAHGAGEGPFLHAWSVPGRWYAESADQPVVVEHGASAAEYVALADGLVAACRERLAVTAPGSLAYRGWLADDGWERDLPGLDLDRMTVTYHARPGPDGGVERPVAVLRRAVAGREVVNRVLAPRDGSWVPSAGPDNHTLRLPDPLAARVIAGWRANLAPPPAPPADLRWSESFDGLPAGGPPLRAFERAAVGGYLSEAPVAVPVFGFDTDRRDPQHPKVVPLSLHTDGEWLWSEADAYYAERYGVAPDPGLLAHVRQRDFRLPAVDTATLRRAAGAGAGRPLSGGVPAGSGVGVNRLYTVAIFERFVDVPEFADDRSPTEWLTQQLEVWGRPVDGEPADAVVSTTWFGVPATVRVLEEEDLDGRLLAFMTYRALLIEVDRAAVETKAQRSREGRAYQWQAAVAFRDLCDALDPEVAFVHREPVADIAGFVQELWEEHAAHGFAGLPDYNFPLWYVEKARVSEVPRVLGQTVLRNLPARNGTVVLTGEDVDNWVWGSVDDWML